MSLNPEKTRLYNLPLHILPRSLSIISITTTAPVREITRLRCLLHRLQRQPSGGKSYEIRQNGEFQTIASGHKRYSTVKGGPTGVGI